MKSFLKNIDLRRLSGLTTILGIDLSESGFTVVELRRTGNPLNKYSSGFRLLNSFSIEFDDNLAIEERIRRIKEDLEAKAIQTRRAVVGIRSAGVKSVQAISSGENIEEWISENYEKLLKLPVALSELSFAYDQSRESGAPVEITFIRKTELDSLKNSLIQEEFQIMGLHAGGLSEREKRLAQKIAESLGLGPVYHDAVCLAIHGFLPETVGIDFLTREEQERNTANIYKSLFHRTVFASGGMLMFLLLLPMLASFYLQLREGTIEQKLLESGNSYAEVKSLEEQVARLDNQSSGEGGLRSNLAQVLHDLARSSGEGLWFSKVAVTATDRTTEIAVTGYAKGSEEITRFLKALQAIPAFSQVNLVRSGAVSESREFLAVRNISASFVAFQIKAMFN